MTSISPVGFSVFAAETTKPNKASADSGFDALLASIGTNSKSNAASDILGLGFGFNELAEALIDNMLRSLESAVSSKSPAAAFRFTPSFLSTFGATGPLPDYIARMSGELQLNSTQKIAFQDIAVKNKDATKTPETIQKIAEELRQAGIGRIAT